jgi:hypothetical protein
MRMINPTIATTITMTTTFGSLKLANLRKKVEDRNDREEGSFELRLKHSEMGLLCFSQGLFRCFASANGGGDVIAG